MQVSFFNELRYSRSARLVFRILIRDSFMEMEMAATYDNLLTSPASQTCCSSTSSFRSPSHSTLKETVSFNIFPCTSVDKFVLFLIFSPSLPPFFSFFQLFREFRNIQVRVWKVFSRKKWWPLTDTELSVVENMKPLCKIASFSRVMYGRSSFT